MPDMFDQFLDATERLVPLVEDIRAALYDIAQNGTERAEPTYDQILVILNDAVRPLFRAARVAMRKTWEASDREHLRKILEDWGELGEDRVMRTEAWTEE